MFYSYLWYVEELYSSSVDEPDIIEDIEEFDSSSFPISDDPVFTALIDEYDLEDSTEDFDLVLLVFEDSPIESLLDDPNTEEDYQSDEITFFTTIEDSFISVFIEDIDVDESSEEDIVEPLPIALLVATNNFDELVVVLLDEVDFEDEDESHIDEAISDYTIIIISTDEELFHPAVEENYDEDDADESYFDFNDYTVTTPESVTPGGRQITEAEVEAELRTWWDKVIAYADGTLSAELGKFHSDGGFARAKSLTPDQRTAIARQGAFYRWQK